MTHARGVAWYSFLSIPDTRQHLLPSYVFFTARTWRLRFGREVGLWPWDFATVTRGALRPVVFGSGSVCWKRCRRPLTIPDIRCIICRNMRDSLRKPSIRQEGNILLYLGVKRPSNHNHPEDGEHTSSIDVASRTYVMVLA